MLTLYESRGRSTESVMKGTSMTNPTPVRVMLVDDYDMVRRGLAVMLQAFDDLQLVGEAANSVEALRLCAELQPDVVLMDLVMPEMDGVAATRAIRQQFPDIQVIALTSFKEETMVGRALQAGAVGYLLKNVSIDELANAIRAAHTDRPPSPGHDLTPRERDVLALLVEGLSNPEIAERLETSHSTVKTDVSNILVKLGVASHTEAVTFALQHNLGT